MAVGSVSLRDADDLARAKSRNELGEPVSAVIARNNGRLIKIVNLEPATAGDSDEGSTPVEKGDPEMVQAPSSSEPQVEEAAPAPVATVDAKAAAPTPTLRGPEAAGTAEPTPQAEAHDREATVDRRMRSSPFHRVES